ncbi:hypothetical protein DL98DRAFT_579760 [Cadophora sp. DSE1049]|nr:hypothetical protein DL98DRAFT_579760 [Cadophora sp. DSE1049]
MPPLFPHMKFYHFNTRKNYHKSGTSTSQDSSSCANTAVNETSQNSEVCDTCGCVHGFSLFVHEDKIECALNQIKKLESHKPKMKVYPPIEEVLPNFSLKTIIGFHKDDIDYWALAMCWRYRARVLMLHLEIAARTGDEEGIRRAKANFEDAGNVLEESIDEVFALMDKNFERIFQVMKWKFPRPPTAVEEDASMSEGTAKENTAENESATMMFATEGSSRRDSMMMDDCTKDISLLEVTAEEYAATD